MLEDRLEALFKKPEEYTILEGGRFKGSTLVGKKYEPLFPYYAHLKSTEPDSGAFRIVRWVGGEGGREREREREQGAYMYMYM